MFDFSEKPYQLFNGDCLAVMKEFADKSIDCVITDLPYGTTACSWDIVIPFEPMWKELKRICKPKAAIVLFGSQPFTSILISSNLRNFRYQWVWDKNRVTGGCIVKFQPMKAHEDITVFSQLAANYYPQNEEWKAEQIKRMNSRGYFVGKGEMRFADHKTKGRAERLGHGRAPVSILRFPALGSIDPERSGHPTQKPVELLRYLIRTYTLENETVLDFTMGSGTSGVACAIENRKFIGIEKDEYYFSVAEARIKRANLEPVDIPKRIIEKEMPLFGL